MAETAEETRHSDEQRERPPAGQGNHIVWWVLVVLVVVFFVLGALAGKKSSTPTSTVNRGTRAVIVPTADAARTVIVPPCATGTTTLSSDVATLMNTTGTTSVLLPQGQGTRVVLVPRCGAGHGAASGTSNLPSALFLLKPGTPVPQVRPGAGSTGTPEVAAPGSAQLQVTVPAGSPIKTVVVPPCEKQQVSGPVERVLGPAGGTTTAVAPAC